MRAALIGVLRDLRGVVTSCANRRTYSLFFDWIYPEFTPTLQRAAVAYHDQPEARHRRMRHRRMRHRRMRHHRMRRQKRRMRHHRMRNHAAGDDAAAEAVRGAGLQQGAATHIRLVVTQRHPALP